MSPPVLSVRDLGKAYRTYSSEWKRFANWLGLTIAPAEEHWALRNITFDVHAGEAVGIAGMNGAGKSTLLKLITGTARPTAGNVSVAGRIAAILELGMGFNPELTGRQNVQHAAGLMGIPGDAIERAMPSIEEFAEIEDYFDQPVRTYSSGMQARVSFAVATAIRPDVLIVDEALSVGDAYFQHKSFDRIREFRKGGTTLLLVSHDKGAIQSICDRAILLNAGRIEKEGSPEEVFDYYNALIADKESATVRQRATASGKVQTISGTGEAVVEEIQLLNGTNERAELVDVGEPVTMRVAVRVKTSIPRLVLGYMIKDRLGQVMYGTNTHLKELPQCDVAANELVIFNIRFPMRLGPGSYSVSTALVSTDTHLVNNYEWRDLALVFQVVNTAHAHFAGCAWLDPLIQIERA